jgi:hypothetical protein
MYEEIEPSTVGHRTKCQWFGMRQNAQTRIGTCCAVSRIRLRKLSKSLAELKIRARSFARFRT